MKKILISLTTFLILFSACKKEKIQPEYNCGTVTKIESGYVVIQNDISNIRKSFKISQIDYILVGDTLWTAPIQYSSRGIGSHVCVVKYKCSYMLSSTLVSPNQADNSCFCPVPKW